MNANFDLTDPIQLVVFILALLIVNTIPVMLSLRKTHEAAADAKRNTLPIGNGFAGAVTRSLSRIEIDLADLQRKVDHHIQVHADKEISS